MYTFVNYKESNVMSLCIPQFVRGALQNNFILETACKLLVWENNRIEQNHF